MTASHGTEAGAGPERRFDQGLGVGEPSLQQRQARLDHGGHEASRRLAHLGGQALRRVEGLPVLRHPAGQEEHHGAVVLASAFSLLVLRGAGHRPQFLGDRQPPLRVAGPHQRVHLAGKGVRQSGRVIERPGQGDRLPAERLAWPAVGLVAERDRQVGQYPGADRPRALVACEHGPRLLQEGNHLPVAGAALEREPRIGERGLAQLLGHLVAARDAGRLAELFPGRLALAHPVQRIPQRDQQPAPGLVLPGRPGQAEGSQGHPEQPDRFFIGQQRHRAAPGPPGVADRLAGAADRRRLEEMAGQLGQVRVQVLLVKLLQGLTGLLVQPKAPAGRDAVIQGVADQRVAEPQQAGRAGNRGHQPGGDARVQDVQQLARRESGKLFQRGQRELAPEHRRQAEYPAAWLWQARRPPPDDRADPFRDGQRQPRRVDGPLQAALGGQQPGHLPHEQRVALGAAVHGRHHALPRHDPGDLLDEAGDAGLIQAGKPNVPGRRFAGKLRQRDGQRVAAVQLNVAVGAQHQHPGVAELAGSEPQQQDRGRVSGMQIIQHEHQRLPGPGIAQERGHRVEQAEPGALRFHRRGRADIGQHLGDLRHDLRDEGGARSQLRPELLAVETADQGPQRLHPRPVRRCPAGLPAPPPRHLDPAIPGPRRRLTGQAALPDPRIPGQQEQPARPAGRVVEPGQQLSQLAVPPDQCRCCPQPILHPAPLSCR